MRGGSHKPFQTPCPGTTLWGTGPRHQEKKEGEAPVPAYHETTLVNPTLNPVAPYTLPSPHPCGSSDTVCTGIYNFKTNSGGGCGPWPVDNDVPARFFATGTRVTKVTIADGGVLYTAGNVLTVTGGTPNNNLAQIKVDTVDGTGKILTAHILPGNGFSTTSPATPNSPTGGTGHGASFNLIIVPSKIDLTTCRKKSFKNVQAQRFWHGVRPWNCGLGNNDKCLANGTWPTGSGPAFASFQPTVNDEKYTIAVYDLVYDISATLDNVTGNSHSTATGSVSVDPLSGVCTSNLVTAMYSYETGNGDYPGQTYQSIGGVGWSRSVYDNTTTYFTSGGTSSLNGSLGDLHLPNFPAWPEAFGPYSSSLLDFITTWNAQFPLDDDELGMGYTGNPLPQVTDFNNYSGSANLVAGYSGTQTVVLSFSRSAEIVKWDFSYTRAGGGTPPVGTSFHYSGSIKLSGANSGSTVYADALLLTSLWDLTDDILYPFRSDENTGIAPLVTRREVQSNVSPVADAAGTLTIDGSAWVDPNAAKYDGAIIGEPLAAGYGYRADDTSDGVFDFRHTNYINCPPNPNPVPPDILSYGARTPLFLPQNCSQWTPDQYAALMTPGKFSLFGNIDVHALWTPDIGLWVQDWVEVADVWPSYNLARPAGADRFVFDETTAAGVDLVYQVASGYSAGPGDTIYLTDSFNTPLAHAPTINSGDVWGGASVGGFYTISSVSGHPDRVLLGAKVFNVPTGWTCPSGDMATAFGRLRFPTCPGILGRAGVTAVTNATLCHLTTESLPYLAMNLTNSPPASEMVDLCDKLMTVLASNVAVTRVSDTEFTVPNSGATAYATIAATAYVVAHGAAAYYWDDNLPKGNLLTVEFGFDYRRWAETRRINTLITACDAHTSVYAGCDCTPMGYTQEPPPYNNSSFTQTQHCVPITQCSPRLVPMPPFPGSFPMDEQYGSRWQAMSVTGAHDLLWQRPHTPIIYNELLDQYDVHFAWIEDDGTCHDDVTYTDGAYIGQTAKAYYAHGPVIEPFINMPVAGMSGAEAAPALPTGIVVGLISPVDNSGPDVTGAPLPGGSVSWTLHNNMCGCLPTTENAGKRFAALYSNLVVDC
jgi:hypothetical protein